MMFNSVSFMLFLPIVFCIYWMLGSERRKSQNLFIVAASYLFYGAWDWRFLILIAFTTLCSWWSGVLLDNGGNEQRTSRDRLIAGANITVNIIILGIFKYYNFFAASFSELFGFAKDDVVMLKLILPVGISFYTFQALSYTIDVYRHDIKPTRDAVAFFAYVSFFPQLVAGPIERATNLLPQFLNPRKFDYSEAVDGCRRMLWGFFKKLVIADNCAVYVNYAWTNYEDQSGSTLLLGLFFFSFQIYGDFSGYSDIAIGCSKLFGIRLRDNFISPFFSRDIAEFWRRWHISLNTWFVDYIYIPLGGSRRGKAIKIRNTFVIFLLSGLWHGANWTYVLWGLYHALLIVPLTILNKGKRFTDIQNYSLSDIPRVLCTFMLVFFGWILFRAPSITDSWNYCSCIITKGILQPAHYDKYVVTPAAIAIVVCLLTEWFQKKRRHGLDLVDVKSRWVRYVIYYALFTAMVLYTGDSQTFIYFQF